MQPVSSNGESSLDAPRGSGLASSNDDLVPAGYASLTDDLPRVKPCSSVAEQQREQRLFRV